MFDLYTAEQQYHHDTVARAREHALLVSIREHELAAAAPPLTITVRTVAARQERAAWPRPIGVQTAECCAVA